MRMYNSDTIGSSSLQSLCLANQCFDAVAFLLLLHDTHLTASFPGQSASLHLNEARDDVVLVFVKASYKKTVQCHNT